MFRAFSAVSVPKTSSAEILNEFAAFLESPTSFESPDGLLRLKRAAESGEAYLRGLGDQKLANLDPNDEENPFDHDDMTFALAYLHFLTALWPFATRMSSTGAITVGNDWMENQIRFAMTANKVLGLFDLSKELNYAYSVVTSEGFNCGNCHKPSATQKCGKCFMVPIRFLLITLPSSAHLIDLFH